MKLLQSNKLTLFKFLPILFLAIYVISVFWPMALGRLPIPADTIVGLYHPWRDKFADQYPNGIPYKNFLITDPVRQQYPWRELAIEQIKKGEWPTRNPYSGLGAPLLANIQTAALYPLNLIYFLLPFSWGWSLQVLLQPVLGGIFMWLYLHSQKLRPEACALGVIAWVGSGFFISWLEWNTLVQVVIWLPLILLSIDKIFREKRQILWGAAFIFAMTSSFLAGHLQIFFYISLLTGAYILRDLLQTKNCKSLGVFLISALSFLILALPQWLPTISLLQTGIRSTSLNDWLIPGWFIPWQHLAQFLAPDFFGNPATGNYFGTWNYGEMIGYIGLIPLIFALGAINKKNAFWLVVLSLSLLLALPNFISQLPYQLKIPFLATVQPTRLLVLADLSLAVLAAMGFDNYLRSGKISLKPIFLVSVGLLLLWLSAWQFKLAVSLKNLFLPSALFAMMIILIIFQAKFRSRLKISGEITAFVLLFFTVFDLSRFAAKFESFSPPQWLYPQTQITKFLSDQSQASDFRVMALDDRIFPPNFSTHYHVKMVSNYDSLYSPQEVAISGGVSRILTPKDYSDATLARLNVKYLLTFTDLDPRRFKLVMQEGQTKVYEVIHNYPSI